MMHFLTYLMEANKLCNLNKDDLFNLIMHSTIINYCGILISNRGTEAPNKYNCPNLIRVSSFNTKNYDLIVNT